MLYDHYCPQSSCISQTILHELDYGISPNRPSLTIKGQNNSGGWVQTTMITEGQKVALLAEGDASEFVYEYSWYEASDVTTIPETEWKLADANGTNNYEFTIPHVPNIYTNIPKRLWFRAFSKVSDNPVIGKSFGYGSNWIDVYRKPQFEVDPIQNFCYGGAGTNVIAISTVQFPLSGLNRIDFKIKQGTQVVPYWSKEIYTSGNFTLTHSGGLSNFLAPGDYTLVAENVWIINGVKFAAGDTTVELTVTPYPRLNDLLINNTIRQCSEDKEINVFKDTTTNYSDYFLQVCNSTSTNNCTVPTTVTNGLVNLAYNTNKLNFTIHHNEHNCTEEKEISVTATHPYFTFTSSFTKLCSGKALIKVNISQDLGVFYDSLYFRVDGVDSTKHISKTIAVTTDGIKTVTVGFYKNGLLSCEQVGTTENITLLKPITFALSSSSLIGCASAKNGSITISSITNAFAKPNNECTVNLLKDGSIIATKMFSSITTATSYTFSNLAAGSYTVELKDGNGCEKVDSISIMLQGDPFSITHQIIQEPSPCAYSTNGSVQIIAHGNGNDSYQVSKDNLTWQTSNTLGNFSGGAYTVYARPIYNSTGIAECTVSATVPFTAQAAVVITATVTQPTCSNSMGSITLDGAASYQMQTKSGWMSISNPISLNSGTYTFMGTNSNGCISNKLSVTIDPVPQIGITDFLQVNPNCFGGFGSISFKIGQQMRAEQYTIKLNNEKISKCSSIKGIEPNGKDLPCFTVSNGLYTIGNLSAGSYTLEVTQGSLCSSSVNFVITQPSQLQINLIPPTNGYPIQCNGGTTNFEIGIVGGVVTETGYSLTHNIGIYSSPINSQPNTIFSFNFYDVIAGTYNLSATDGNGCYVYRGIVIDEPTSLVLAKDSITIPSCSGSNDGSIYINVGGGVLPYTINYTLDNMNVFTETIISGNTYQIDSLSSGTWLYKLIDKNNCKNPIDLDYNEVTLATPEPMGLDFFDIINPHCYNDSTGSFTIVAYGKENKEKIFELWKNGELISSTPTNKDTLVYDSLPYGDYRVWFKFSSECSTFADTTLTQPDSLTYSLSSINNSCFGSNNGSVTVNVSGGSFPYKVVLFEGEAKIDSVTLEHLNLFEFDSLSPGNYHIQLSDKNTCAVYHPTVTEVPVSNPEAPIGLLLSQTPVDCHGNSTGSITANASGGWGEYKYSIDNGVNWIDDATEHEFSDLAAGNFNIQLKDSMNCTISQTIEVTQPDVLAIANAVADSVSCFGGTDGSVFLTAVGGNGGYTWSFSNGTEVLPDSTIHNLPSNWYSYSVEDVKGCTASESIFVPQPDEFSIEFFTNSYDGYNIKCNGGTDSLWYSVNGGNSPYNMTLNSQNVGLTTEGETYMLPNLFAGNYTLSLEDKKQCPFDKSISLVEPNALIISSVTYIQPLCHNDSNGKIEVVVTEGISPYMYNLEFDAATSLQNDYGKFIDIPSGEYQLRVVDKYGCLIDSVLTLNQPEPVSLNLVQVVPVTCKGGNDGYAEIEGVGGVGNYFYTWYNSSGNSVSDLNYIIDFPANNYLVDIWDSNNCHIAEQLTVEIPEPEFSLGLKSIVFTQPNCYGESNGTILLEAEGGWGQYQYLQGDILNTQGSFNGLQAGSYDFTISDSLNCILNTTVFLSQPELLEISLDSLVNVTCNGVNSGKIYVSAGGGNGGNEYNINELYNATGEFTDLAAGGYTILVKDTMGCNASIDTTITQPFAITYASADIIRPTCGNANGAITINTPSGGTGSISITWESELITGTGFVVDSLPSGNYGFKLTDELGCTKEFEVILSDINGPEITSFAVTNPTCSYRNDGEIQLEINGDAAPFTVLWNEIINDSWNPATGVLSNLVSGEYLVSVIDTNSCAAFQTFELSTPPPISVNVIATPVSCYGDTNGKLKAEISGGTGTYSGGWKVNESFLGFSVDNLPADSYSLSVYDSNGCGVGNSDEVEAGTYIVEQPTDTLSFSYILSQPKCFGNQNGSISINATEGWGQYKYLLNGGELQLNPIFSNLSAGRYSISVSDKGGCSVHKTVTLGQPSQIDLQLVSIVPVNCFGQSNGQLKVNAIGGTAPYTYSNQSGFNGHGNFFNLPSANYKLYVNDKNNCSDSIGVFVSQPELLEVSVSSILPAHCGSSDGEIQLTAQGGNGLYRAIWTGFESVSSLTLGSIPSGNYNATVVDQKNCISYQVTDDVPEIAGPTLLIDDIVSPLCSYSSDGSIQFSTLNGSAPFTYFANNQLFQNEKVENISGGIYHLKVIDNFGCFDTVTIEVAAPQELAINVIEETNPHCHNFSDGKIRISSTGGTFPHSFSWSNSQTGSIISSLSHGSYTVTLTDNHGCTKQESYVLTNPAQIVVNLPELVTLCAGQSSQIDASNEGSMFWWTSTSGFESFERQIEVSETGSYFLQITNPVGCFAYDTVNVTKHNYEVDATFIIPSEVYVGDTIVAIDISWPIPDSLYWVIPNEFEVVENYLYEQILKPKQVGTFPVGVVTYVGECSAYQQKTISVLPAQTVPAIPNKEITDIFVSASVAPNPAVNSTLLSVELSRIANLNISVHNAFGQKVKALSAFNGNSYSITIPVAALSKGVYMIVLTAETSTRTIKLVVN